jgi:hypothetical protein
VLSISWVSIGSTEEEFHFNALYSVGGYYPGSLPSLGSEKAFNLLKQYTKTWLKRIRVLLTMD